MKINVLFLILVLSLLVIPVYATETNFITFDDEFVTSVEFHDAEYGTPVLRHPVISELPDGCFYTFSFDDADYVQNNWNEPTILSFRIPLDTLKKNSADVTDIILYAKIERDGKPFWDGRATSFLGENNGYALYNAPIVTAGDYAISFRKGAAINTTVIPPIYYEPVTEKPIAESPVPIAGILAGIISAVFLFRKRYF